MPSMMPVISAILVELSLMSCIVSTTWPTTALPFCATDEAFAASALPCCALSAFCFTVDVSSSMLDAVSCSEAACCSVRWLRSILPVAISRAAPAMLVLLSRTRPTIVVSRSFISRKASSSLLVSSLPSTLIRVRRSPCDTVRATSIAKRSGRVTARVISTQPPIASATAIRLIAISRLRCFS